MTIKLEYSGHLTSDEYRDALAASSRVTQLAIAGSVCRTLGHDWTAVDPFESWIQAEFNWLTCTRCEFTYVRD